MFEILPRTGKLAVIIHIHTGCVKIINQSFDDHLHINNKPILSHHEMGKLYNLHKYVLSYLLNAFDMLTDGVLILDNWPFLFMI